MKRDDIILLGLKNRITAFWKRDGSIAWVRELSGGLLAGGGFVTVACDDERVFAYAGGKLYGLDLATGALLWQNDLPGYGYGLAGLCIPGHGSAPDPAIVQSLADADRARDSSSTAASSS